MTWDHSFGLWMSEPDSYEVARRENGLYNLYAMKDATDYCHSRYIGCFETPEAAIAEAEKRGVICFE